MLARLTIVRTASAAALFLIGVAGAAAQPSSHTNLPRSPYALPTPTYQGPDDDDLVNGNGQLHFSGQWRHWGDSRNGGELFSTLFAPNGVLGGQPNGLPGGASCINANRC